MIIASRITGTARCVRRYPRCRKNWISTARRFSKLWKLILKILIQKRFRRRNKKSKTNTCKSSKWNWNTTTWNITKSRSNKCAWSRRAAFSCRLVRDCWYKILKNHRRKMNSWRPWEWHNWIALVRSNFNLKTETQFWKMRKLKMEMASTSEQVRCNLIFRSTA